MPQGTDACRNGSPDRGRLRPNGGRGAHYRALAATEARSFGSRSLRSRPTMARRLAVQGDSMRHDHCATRFRAYLTGSHPVPLLLKRRSSAPACGSPTLSSAAAVKYGHQATAGVCFMAVSTMAPCHGEGGVRFTKRLQSHTCSLFHPAWPTICLVPRQSISHGGMVAAGRGATIPALGRHAIIEILKNISGNTKPLSRIY
jgi:hypothetical protein